MIPPDSPPPLLSPAPQAINNDTSLNSRWCSCVMRPWSIPCGNPHFILQTGMISLSNDTFFIHPLPNHLAKHVTIRNAAKPHLVYRKSATSLHCLDSSGMRRPFSPNMLESVVRFLWCLLVEKSVFEFRNFLADRKLLGYTERAQSSLIRWVC